MKKTEDISMKKPPVKRVVFHMVRKFQKILYYKKH